MCSRTCLNSYTSHRLSAAMFAAFCCQIADVFVLILPRMAGCNAPFRQKVLDEIRDLADNRHIPFKVTAVVSNLPNSRESRSYWYLLIFPFSTQNEIISVGNIVRVIVLGVVDEVGQYDSSVINLVSNRAIPDVVTHCIRYV